MATLALVSLAAPGLGQEEASFGRLNFAYEPLSQQADVEADGASIATGPRYGQEGFDSWVIGFSSATDTKAFDQGFTLSYNRFIVDDVEWLLEAGH